MSIPLVDKPTQEKLVSVLDVSWEEFKGIERLLKDKRSVRLSYLSGILEIMSPIGKKHEFVKSTLPANASLLIRAYTRRQPCTSH
jgi:Uma2 family endonuclease